MNRRQKLVQAQFLNDEEAVIKRLKTVYNKSLEDINGKVKELDSSIAVLQKAYESIDGDEIGALAASVLGKKVNTMTPEEAQETIKSMLQSKVYQKKYQTALKKQVDDIYDKMHDEEFKTVANYLDKCYESGFVGAMYDLNGQGIPLCFPLDQEAMVRAVQLDSKISQGLYTRLGEDVTVLKKKITAQVSRGIATGMSYQQVAQQLAGYTNIGFNNAVRIARTEGHRIQCQSGMDACYKAKEKGADVLKQWDAYLDSRTRESHAKLHGEVRELDERFSNGLRYPGDPTGRAAEVINCRCALLQRARWALDGGFTQMNGFTKEIESFSSPEEFAEFKEAFFSKENRQFMNYHEMLEERYETKDFGKLLDKMNTREYNHYTELMGKSPLYNGGNSKNILTNGGNDGIMSSKNDGFKLIKGKHTIEDDIGTPDVPMCNPKFLTGGIEYQNNCGYCTATYEMRRRGYDVIANPKNTILVDDWKKLFDGFEPMKVEWRSGMSYWGSIRAEILEKCGEGARGAIFVNFKGKRVGHFFSWEVENGVVRFVDGQSGITDASVHFKNAVTNSVICGRLDNLEPSDLIKEACKNRGGN